MEQSALVGAFVSKPSPKPVDPKEEKKRIE